MHEGDTFLNFKWFSLFYHQKRENIIMPLFGPLYSEIKSNDQSNKLHATNLYPT